MDDSEAVGGQSDADVAGDVEGLVGRKFSRSGDAARDSFSRLRAATIDTRVMTISAAPPIKSHSFLPGRFMPLIMNGPADRRLQMLARIGPPPRQVPLSLAVVNIFNRHAQIGWAVLGFGSALFWSYVMRADYSLVTWRGPLKQAPAIVTSIEDTGEKEAKRRVYANHYAFSVAGTEFTGVSYSTGQVVQARQPVTVEYLPADPRQSRIMGMRRRLFSPSVVFLTVIPLIGLVVAVRAMKRGAQYVDLLRNSYELSPPPEIDENGQLRGTMAAALRALIIPAIVVGANALAAAAAAA